MKKANVSSEVLILPKNLEKPRPRSKHSSFSCSRAPFWPYLGLILAPSWPLLGSSWPHLGPSWPHLGPILVSSWPSWPVLAPSWPLLGPVLALLAALGPILALGSLLANWSAFLNPGFRPPLPQVVVVVVSIQWFDMLSWISMLFHA